LKNKEKKATKEQNYNIITPTKYASWNTDVGTCLVKKLITLLKKCTQQFLSAMNEYLEM